MKRYFCSLGWCALLLFLGPAVHAFNNIARPLTDDEAKELVASAMRVFVNADEQKFFFRMTAGEAFNLNVDSITYPFLRGNLQNFVPVELIATEDPGPIRLSTGTFLDFSRATGVFVGYVDANAASEVKLISHGVWQANDPARPRMHTIKAICVAPSFKKADRGQMAEYRISMVYFVR